MYLCLAMTSSVLVSLVMRYSVEKVKNRISMLAVNYTTCLLLSLLHIGPGLVPQGEEGMGTALMLGILAGALLLAGFVLMQWNMEKNGVVLSATFSRLGILVPAVLSVVWFRERPQILQIFGFLLALLAILLIHRDGKKTQAQSSIALLLLLLANGCADAMAKVFEALGNMALENFYLLFTFLAAVGFSLFVVGKKKQRFTKTDLFYGALLGIPNFYSVKFLVKALEEIPAVIIYPTYSVGVILVLSLLGAVLFQEKLSHNQKTALSVILVSLILLNL